MQVTTHQPAYQFPSASVARASCAWIQGRDARATLLTSQGQWLFLSFDFSQSLRRRKHTRKNKKAARVERLRCYRNGFDSYGIHSLRSLNGQHIQQQPVATLRAIAN